MAVPAPVIDTRTGLLDVDKNGTFSFQPVATGSPTLWEASGLPNGLSINASSGLISGAPTVAGLFGVVLSASNYDSKTFSVDSGTDIFTSYGHAYADGDAVTFEVDGGSLPSPLTSVDTYYIRDVSGDTYKVAALDGGTAVNITTTGSGTLTIKKKQTDEITLIIPVSETGSTISANDITMEMNVDILSGKVQVVGLDDGFEFGPPTTTPERDDGYRKAVLLVKGGDRFPVAFGFTRNGVLQDLSVASLRMRGKEFEPESDFNFLSGSFTKTGSGSSTRYKTIIHIDDDTFAGVLSNYESDSGTYVDLFSEIEFTILFNANEYDSTQVEALSPNLTGGASQDDTLSFTAMPQVESSTTYTLDADLAITGRTTQNVSLSLTFDAVYDFDTGLFTASNVTGTQAGQGADEEPAHWRTTFTHVSTTGTASGVDVVMRTAASDLGSKALIILNCDDFEDFDVAANETLTFPDPYDLSTNAEVDVSGLGQNASFTFADGENATTIKANINSALSSHGAPYGATDITDVVLDYPGNRVIIEVGGTNEPNQIEVFDDGGSHIYTKATSNGDTRAGTVTVQVAGDAEDEVYRKTSETFILRTERDITPDL